MLVAVLMVGAVAGLMAQIGSNGGPHQSQNPARLPASILYTTHNPISITSNADFTVANGVSSGTGTASDPYIIADLDINASTTTGIDIENTNAHFIVRNCYIHDGSSISHGFGYNGTYLFNCANGTMENNTCTNDFIGIYLALSNNNTLNKNNCSNGNYGIYLDSSSNDTLVNNTCGSNLYGNAMYLESSNDDVLVNNNCSSNLDGIRLVSSNNNTLVNNTSNSNDFSGIELESSNNNTLSKNSMSSNFQPGIYLQGSNDNLLFNDTCSQSYMTGVDFELSNDNIVVNCSSSWNGYYGITIATSDNNTLFGNDWSYNVVGVWLLFSNENYVVNNLFSNNAEFALVLNFSASDNWIWNNTFYNNNGAGAVYSSSHAQAFDDGISDHWNTSDSPHGYGNYWSDWTTPDANHDGVVDQPYSIAGSASAKDYYPLTTAQTQIPEFGMMPFVVMVLLGMIVLIGATGRRKAP